MKRLILILICLLLFIVDNTLVPFFSIKGVYPSLLFTFAVLYALMSGYWEAVFIGVLSGFLQDVSKYVSVLNSCVYWGKCI